MKAKTLQATLAAAGIVVALMLSGCDSKQTAEYKLQPLPVADVSTPDRALKSYWAQVDWLTATDHALKTHNRAGEAFKDGINALSKVVFPPLVGEANKQYPLYTYGREITEAKVETESRAVVMVKIRNTTPLPAGTVLTAEDSKRREEGDPFKYVLEKHQDAWKVAEIWRWASWNSNFEKVQPITTDSPPIYVSFGGY